MTYATEDQVIRKGKRDEYSKVKGGFVVARMSNGTLDYFPAGHTPTLNGDVDKNARIVRRFFWNYKTWKEIN